MAKDAFVETRMILAMDRNLPVPKGGLKPRVVAAFNDLKKGKKQMGLMPVTELHDQAQAEIAILVKQRLLVPVIKEAKKSRDIVRRVRDLSRSPKFRAHRQEYYAWQEESADDVVLRGKSVDRIVSELEARVGQLNHWVFHYLAGHWPEITVATAVTAIGVGLPVALGLEHIGQAHLLGFVPGAFELARFGTLEVAVPAIKSKRKSEAAAMLVSARKVVAK